MKPHRLIYILLILSFFSRAQYIITATQNEPGFGDIEKRLSLVSKHIYLPDTGQNKFWNYSVLNSLSSIQTYTYIDPATNPELNSYCPNADIAAQLGDGSHGNYTLYRNDSTQNERIGYCAYSSSGYTCNIGSTLQFKFPFTYGDVYSPCINCLSGFTITGAGTGTLALPGYTLTNVLLITKNSFYFNTNSFPATSQTGNEYFFFSADSKFPLLYITRLVTSGNYGPYISISAILNGDFILGVGNDPENAKINTAPDEFDFYPNPVSKKEGILTLSNKYSASGNTILFYNSLGEKIMEKESSQLSKSGDRIQLYVGHLASGVYYLILNSQGDIIRKKITITTEQ